MAKRRPPARPPLRDWHLWSEVTRSVSPLRPGRVVLTESSPEDAAPEKAGRARHDRPMDAVSHPQRPAPSGPQGLEPRMHRRVRRGQLPIDATIDLHGMRQAEAHAALVRFVNSRAARGDRTLLVITGKGLARPDPHGSAPERRGVLRAMLPLWLAEPDLAPLVAGWEVSARGHGGEGAVYLRLRRPDRVR